MNEGGGYPDDLINLASQGAFEAIRDQAVSDVTGLLDVDPDRIPDMPIATVSTGTTGGASYEDNTITVDLAPDVSDEPAWVEPPHLQAEGIYEEVTHIIAEHIFEQEQGAPRKPRDQWTYWDNAANELLGALYKWEDDWGFDRPLQKADQRLRNADERLDNSLQSLSQQYENGEITVTEYLDQQAAIESQLLNDIIHFIGYSVSEAASTQSYSPREMARMSYEELRDNFSTAATKAQEDLEQEYGILVDFDGRITSDSGFNFFVRTDADEYRSRGVLDGFEEQGRQFYTWQEQELPDRVQ